jgi:hypothetical protein
VGRALPPALDVGTARAEEVAAPATLRPFIRGRPGITDWAAPLPICQGSTTTPAFRHITSSVPSWRQLWTQRRAAQEPLGKLYYKEYTIRM